MSELVHMRSNTSTQKRVHHTDFHAGFDDILRPPAPDFLEALEYFLQISSILQGFQ